MLALKYCVKNVALRNAAKFSSVAAVDVVKPLVSVVKHPFSIDGTPLPTDKELIRKDMFAVISYSGTQFKVTHDDTIVVDKMQDIDIDDVIDINSVLLVGNRNATIIGRPAVAGATVRVAVEEITKDKKVITLKFRRRKHSQRLKGFRRQVVILRVKDIIVSDETASDMGL